MWTKKHQEFTFIMKSAPGFARFLSRLNHIVGFLCDSSERWCSHSGLHGCRKDVMTVISKCKTVMGIGMSSIWEDNDGNIMVYLWPWWNMNGIWLEYDMNEDVMGLQLGIC